MSRQPCKPCAAARKFMPRTIRERLEKLEQRLIEESKRKEAERAARQA